MEQLKRANEAALIRQREDQLTEAAEVCASGFEWLGADRAGHLYNVTQLCISMENVWTIAMGEYGPIFLEYSWHNESLDVQCKLKIYFLVWALKCS